TPTLAAAAKPRGGRAWRCPTKGDKDMTRHLAHDTPSVSQRGAVGPGRSATPRPPIDISHQAEDPASRHDPEHHSGHHGHGWMMIACCVPMLALAVILVATGAVSPGFLLVAIGCMAMMALMMRGMGSH